MTKRNLQWYGAVPNKTKNAAIRRCILQYTSESMDVVRIFGKSRKAIHLFGTVPNVDTKRDGAIPFTYKDRFFLAILREDFLVVFEDKDLNMRALINLMECNPTTHENLPFAEYFEHYMQNELIVR